MTLPAHGPIDCRTCWGGCAASERGFGGATPAGGDRFRLVNDPGAWGAVAPRILVLGMSKGNTQSDAMRDAARTGDFDAVPFRKMRPRLLQVLQSVGLMQGETEIDRRFRAEEPDYAWGSVLRCSLTGFDAATGKYSAASSLVVQGMGRTEGAAALDACVARHLLDLPERTRLVILLGNASAYMALLRKAFQRVFPDATPGPAGEMPVFRAGGRSFVHVGHPSPLNGHLAAFLQGDPGGGQGAKREAARRAVDLALEDLPDRDRL